MIIPEYDAERRLYEKRIEMIRMLESFLIAGLDKEDLYGMTAQELKKHPHAELIEPYSTWMKPFGDVNDPVDVNERLKEIAGKCYGKRKSKPRKKRR